MSRFKGFRRLGSLVGVIILTMLAGRYSVQHHKQVGVVFNHASQTLLALAAIILPLVFIVWAVIKHGRIKTIIAFLLGIAAFPATTVALKYLHGPALHLLWWAPAMLALIWLNVEPGLPKWFRTNKHITRLARRRGFGWLGGGTPAPAATTYRVAPGH